MVETRAEWLARRREFLGASEVAAVCGLDPFKTALDVWASKKGIIQSEESEAAGLGHLLEPVILQWYANTRGVRLQRPGTMFGAEPWMAASLDAIAADRRNVQAKAVGRYMAQHWDNGAPDYVQAQTQWEMMVSGLAVTDVAALICSTEFRIIEVAADPSIQSYELEICSRFWRDNIIGDRMPELDASETARAILLALNPQRGAMVEATAADLEMVARHLELDGLIDGLTSERETLRNKLRQRIGTNQGLEWPAGRVTWKTNKAGDRPLRIYQRTP